MAIGGQDGVGCEYFPMRSPAKDPQAQARCPGPALSRPLLPCPLATCPTACTALPRFGRDLLASWVQSSACRETCTAAAPVRISRGMVCLSGSWPHRSRGDGQSACKAVATCSERMRSAVLISQLGVRPHPPRACSTHPPRAHSSREIRQSANPAPPRCAAPRGRAGRVPPWLPNSPPPCA
jgi:hypothetical protein